MIEVLIALAFLVLASILGQCLIPRVTSTITVSSSHMLAVGSYVCIGGSEYLRVSSVTPTSFTFERKL